MENTNAWLSKLVIMALIIVMAVTSASAKSHKMFPANHGSVALENSYAERAGIARYAERQQIEAGVAAGVLVPVPITVCPKLPEFRRYVRPAAAQFLSELDARFYQATGRYLIVDSAVRSADVQRQVARRNKNAAPANGERASSHERGTTFDLASRRVFKNGWSNMRRSHYRWLLIQLAYYQAIGRIHVIEERSCLHIMVREDYDVPSIPFVSPSINTIAEGDGSMASGEPQSFAGRNQMVLSLETLHVLPIAGDDIRRGLSWSTGGFLPDGDSVPYR